MLLFGVLLSLHGVWPPVRPHASRVVPEGVAAEVPQLLPLSGAAFGSGPLAARGEQHQEKGEKEGELEGERNRKHYSRVRGWKQRIFFRMTHTLLAKMLQANGKTPISCKNYRSTPFKILVYPGRGMRRRKGREKEKPSLKSGSLNHFSSLLSPIFSQLLPRISPHSRESTTQSSLY